MPFICEECGNAMVLVGSSTRPLPAQVFVCSAKNCESYAHMSGVSIVRSPAMTLDSSLPLHANIMGAMAFRDRV